MLRLLICANRKFLISLVSLVGLIGVFSLVGCQQAVKEPVVQPLPRMAAPVEAPKRLLASVPPRRPIRSDIELQSSIFDLLALSGTVARDVQVEVRDGDVILTGRVTKLQEGLALEQTIRQFKGVNSVENKLGIGIANVASPVSGWFSTWMLVAFGLALLGIGTVYTYRHFTSQRTRSSQNSRTSQRTRTV